MNAFISRLIREDAGQDLVEYGLLAAIVSIAATATLLIVGPEIRELYSVVASKVKSATSATVTMP